MGACIGKKSSKHVKDNQFTSDIPQVPQIQIQDDHSASQPSPSSSKKFKVADEFVFNNGDDIRLTIIDDNEIDSEVNVIIKEQDEINTILNQPFSTRVVSISDTELEYELANLIYGCPAIDYKENPLATTTATLKSVDA
ncbi:unnamed protein product [Adineta ricciae]|uniref:Uncharacterized protein n=1 Tax=Adineta ricciae TaxID=249248 RepID=A0A815AQ86_ADIRI|nr:unnamed protein product [Adineta ricciae]CAF1261114.1 unnamed protein product [Adineta ricciae]